MSCNGCRVLRRGCTEQCILRPCLDWIQSPQAQANATLFVSKFFGRSDLMSFISAVPEYKRPALFQSLLFEACGRTVNPVGGVVGLLSTGNWHICQAAVETVLDGGALRPLTVGIPPPSGDEESEAPSRNKAVVMHGHGGDGGRNRMEHTASFGSGLSEISPELERGSCENVVKQVGSKRPKLLNLFD
ncbi:LOB domain-containing protein 38 [Phtheirospermum japonicum]|uniref:LOB domain-containing protein 38 n=1 Tax=Phtheirospermum japonicum TaxID=374723 RepID=A0A830BA79_9LAMI|nr:LOB domain-containing protein 38 [Phtheirospermum japonicum]